jgi:hypothetical protein
MSSFLDPPGNKRNFTAVIAAADSSAGATDYRCTGTADQSTINSVIAALGSQGGKILLRQGTYNLTGSIVVDRDCVTIEGENRPHWGQSVDAEGLRATKLKATTGGFDMLTVSTANAGPESRLRGLAFRDLYFYGNNKSGYGIKDLTHTDVSEISNCFFHECAAGIYVGWDTPLITRNNVQFCASGIRVNYHYGSISQNLVYDCSTWGIQVEGQGQAVVGNIIGQCTNGLILSAAQGATATGNVLSGAKGTASAVLLDQGAKWNTVTGNTVGVHGVITNMNLANVTGDGIQVGSAGSACVGNTISGNTLVAQASTAGYAIACRNSSTRNTITGNTIESPSTWNGGSTTTILVGTGNTVANNGGHT